MELEKLHNENDSDLEIVFDYEEQAEILHCQKKVEQTDYEFISGITIEADYLNNESLIPSSQICPAFLDPLLELGDNLHNECQEKNQVVASNTSSSLINPVSPDSTETNSAQEIHQMLTRQEATQIISTCDVSLCGQSGVTNSSNLLNYQINTGSADQMQNLASVAHFPPLVNSQQINCDSSLLKSVPKLGFQIKISGGKFIVGNTPVANGQNTPDKALVQCPHCRKTYTRKDNLKHHIKRVHYVCIIHESVTRCQQCRECTVCCGGQCLEERTFTCSNCACEVPNEEMRQHLLVQPCQTCGVHFPCTTAYTSHWQNGQCLMPTISKEMYPNVFGDSDTTLTSWNTPDETNTHGFYVPNQAVSVEEAPNVEKEFPCPLCNRSFFNKQSLPLHMRTIHPDAIYCRLCCLVFDANEQLEVHHYSNTCTPIKVPDYVGDFSTNDGHVEPSSTSNIQIEPQVVKKKRRSSSTANLLCPFCTKAYCRRDKVINHIKNAHPGKCWYCHGDMMLMELKEQCQQCWQQFCCTKLLKLHKCTVCVYCKLNIPVLELKIHVCKRSCLTCDQIFACATASINHVCPLQLNNVNSNGNSIVPSSSFVIPNGSNNVPN